MAFANEQLIPYTIYGGVSTVNNGAVNTLSGFTNSLTEFEFVLDTTDPVFDYISSDSTVWDFGDGSISKGVSASHVYNFPGTYNVTLVAYDSGGNEYLSTRVRQLSVTDFLPDRLTFANNTISNTLNIPSNIKNAIEAPITIDRQNTHQLHKYLSGTNYSIHLYASGSDSFDRGPRLDDKWVHLDTTWSFYTSTTADNNEVQLHECTSVQSTTEEIYYRYYSHFKSPVYKRVPISDLEKHPSAVFVGTTGAATFYYGDTLPKLTKMPIFVFCDLDMTNIPNYRQLLRPETYVPLHNNDLQYPSIYGTFQLVIPIRTRYRPAKKLVFTSSGLQSLALSKNKWQYCESPFFVSLADEDGNITASYPDLSGWSASPAGTTKTDTFVANLSTISTSNTLLSTHFYRNNNLGLPSRIRGVFPGYMIPYETEDDIKLRVEGAIYTEPHFSKDTILFGIPNRDTKQVNIGFTQETYRMQELNVDLTESLRFIRTTFTDGVVCEPTLTYYHTSTSYTSDKMVGLFTGTRADGLSTFNTYSQLASTFSLSGINDAAKTRLPTSNDLIVADYHNGPGFASSFLIPAATTVSKDKSIWVALSGSSIAMNLTVDQYRRATYGYTVRPTIENVVGVDENVLYTTVNNFAPQHSPTGTRNLFEPTLIDTDIRGDVWLGFTNELSGSVRKYETNRNADITNYEIFTLFASKGEHSQLLDQLTDKYGASLEPLVNDLDSGLIGYLLTNYQINLYDVIEDFTFQNNNKRTSLIEFDHVHTIPTDIATTNVGDIWTATRDITPTRSADITFATGTVSALSAGSDTIKLSAGSDPTAAGLSAGYIINVTGYSGDPAYNGTFLVSDVTDQIITIKPYIGKVTSIISSPLVEADIAIYAYTDHVYKHDTSGTVLYNLSGFFEPGYACTDKYQNLWVAHDVNTITKITSAGAISTSIKVYDTAHAHMWTSAGATYAYTASADTLHLGGITFDTYDNMYVINSYEGRMYKIPLNTPTLSSSYTISDTIIAPNTTHNMPRGRFSSRGDWNGFKWLNKFDNSVGVSTLTGETTLSVYSTAGRYTVAKINENFDPIETVKSYRTQPLFFTQNNMNLLFDELYGTIIGTVSSAPTSIGRVTYEKIANFTDNLADVDTCNINALYSLCNMVNLPITRYDFDYSGGLHRIMNLISIPHKRLWGERSEFGRDFQTYGTANDAYGKNLGTKMSPLTSYITAGVPIVAHQMYNNEFRYINPMYVSGGQHCTGLTRWNELAGVVGDPTQPAQYEASGVYESEFGPYWDNTDGWYPLGFYRYASSTRHWTQSDAGEIWVPWSEDVSLLRYDIRLGTNTKEILKPLDFKEGVKYTVTGKIMIAWDKCKAEYSAGDGAKNTETTKVKIHNGNELLGEVTTAGEWEEFSFTWTQGAPGYGFDKTPGIWLGAVDGTDSTTFNVTEECEYTIPGDNNTYTQPQLAFQVKDIKIDGPLAGKKNKVTFTYSWISAGTRINTNHTSLSTYSVSLSDHVDGSVTQNEFRQEVRDAFLEWEQLIETHYPWVDVRFIELGEEGMKIPADDGEDFGDFIPGMYNLPTSGMDIGDIRVGMHSIDGDSSNNALAHANGPGGMLWYDLPPGFKGVGNIGGDLHFDADNDWRLDTTPDSADSGSSSIKMTAVHEIGHSLGLGHSDRRDSIMFYAGYAPAEDNFWQHFPNGLSASKVDMECVEFVYPPAIPRRPQSLSAVYHIDTYNQAWGWGLGSNINRENMFKFYNFYHYIAYTPKTQLEGIIDWINPQTTIVETLSDVSTWYGDDNVVDSLLDYELRLGLNMFNAQLSAKATDIL